MHILYLIQLLNTIKSMKMHRKCKSKPNQKAQAKLQVMQNFLVDVIASEHVTLKLATKFKLKNLKSFRIWSFTNETRTNRERMCVCGCVSSGVRAEGDLMCFVVYLLLVCLL